MQEQNAMTKLFNSV